MIATTDGPAMKVTIETALRCRRCHKLLAKAMNAEEIALAEAPGEALRLALVCYNRKCRAYNAFALRSVALPATLSFVNLTDKW